MNQKVIFLSLILITFFLKVSYSQDQKTELTSLIVVNVNYSHQFPGGDLADRFDSNTSIGLGLDYIFPNNLLIGFNNEFLFGSKVNEDVLSNIRQNDGSIIGSDHEVTNVFLRERGFLTNVYFGKLFAISPKNPKSGIRVSVGAGFLLHKIRLLDDNNTVPQVAGNYAAGYDRLTSGFATTQFIGYQHLSKDKRINITFGVEFVQGYTKNLRAYDFNNMVNDDSNRLDLLFGLQLTWSLPFYINDFAEDRSY